MRPCRWSTRRRRGPRGDLLPYTFDAANRLTDIDYQGGGGYTVTFAYDDVGNRTSMVDATGTTSYTYTALNQVATITFPGSRTVTYAYDNTGRRSQILYPDSKTVDYTYDEGGRMKTVTDWLSAVTEYFYNNAGMLDHTDYANGVTTSYGYDTADRLTSVVTTGPGPTTIASATYTLDDAGIRTAMVTPGGTTSYQYDDLYRLTRVDYPGSVFETFDYDETGNRIQRVTTDYAYNDAD